MASSDLAKFYAETCQRIDRLESEKRAIIDRQKTRAKNERELESLPAAASEIRGQCVAERFKKLENYQTEFRFIEKQLNQRLQSSSLPSDTKSIESEIMHWKKRLLTRNFIWQASITHDHWYFTKSLIHYFVSNNCGRHPLCGVETHLKPLVDPGEQDPAKWEAALRSLSTREPMPGLLFVATQTTKPPSTMFSSQSKSWPVSAYVGKYADRVSQLLGRNREIKTDAGMVPGGLPNFLRLFGTETEAEFIRFLVVCNLENDYLLIDFSQSQASRGALLKLFRSPSVEKIVWNKESIMKSLQFTLWADPDSFNEIYDLSIPWNIGTGTRNDDIRYLNEVSEYLRTPSSSSASSPKNGELAAVANVLFHTKELGEISGSSIIDLVLNEKSDWIMNDQIVGWERIDPKIFVSQVVTVTTLADVSTATAILNPNWRMGLGCPSILSMGIEKFLNTTTVPKQCIGAVVENAELPFPKCRYNADCLHDFVQQNGGNSNSTIGCDRKIDDHKLIEIQKEIDDAFKQKADLEQMGPMLNRNSSSGAGSSRRTLAPAPGFSGPRAHFGPGVPSGPMYPGPAGPPAPMLPGPSTFGGGYGPPISGPMMYEPEPVHTNFMQNYGGVSGPRGFYPQEGPRPARPPFLRSPNPPFYGHQQQQLRRFPSKTIRPPPPPPKPQLNKREPPMQNQIDTPISMERSIINALQTSIPQWVRSYSMPRLPLFSEKDQDWARIPVPRLTLPVYYKCLDNDDPLMPVLIQWRRDYRRAFNRWSKKPRWDRCSIFLGALATDAQLMACRLVNHMNNSRKKKVDVVKYSYASLTGLLIEFCVYVETITRVRVADWKEKLAEMTKNARLKRLMIAAMADQEKEEATAKQESIIDDGEDGEKSFDDDREEEGSIIDEGGEKSIIDQGSEKSIIGDHRDEKSIADQQNQKSPDKEIGAQFQNKRQQKTMPTPKNQRLFYDMADLYPLAIDPSTTFSNLKSFFYRGACTNSAWTGHIGSEPHPLCDLLPKQILPPRVVLHFVQTNPQRLQFKTYEPFAKSSSNDQTQPTMDGDQAEPMAKKPRVDGGGGLLDQWSEDVPCVSFYDEAGHSGQQVGGNDFGATTATGAAFKFEITCHRCGGIGHLRRTCPLKQQSSGQMQQ